MTAFSAPSYDLAIVGSGFGGSLLAMIARRLGLSVVLLERGKHPRFAIGESTSPLTNLLLEQLAQRYDLPRLLPLTSYGPWQQAYPEIGCGLKRGFTYFHHEAGKPYRAREDRANQLLVAANPNDALADTHWLRSDVDHFFVREAIALGADYRDETLLSSVSWPQEDKSRSVGPSTTALLFGKRQGNSGGSNPFHVRARLVIDATGPSGFLSRALQLPATAFAGYPSTQTLYSHFRGVRRCDQMEAFQATATAEKDNRSSPYPIDDAALHHVFEGGWMWVLRFGNGITSAGIAVTDDLANQLCLSGSTPEAAWKRFLQRYPSIGEQFAAAEHVRPFVFAPRLSYRCSTASGKGWALLPSAAAFVDPLFSTGMPLTLLGVERLGRILEEAWDSPALWERLEQYGATTLEEADWTAGFIGACYTAFGHFPHFATFSMFYFAAASFSEIARRTGQGHLVRRYLAADHARFSQGLARCAAELLQVGHSHDKGIDLKVFKQEVAQAVAPLNVAGLCDEAKRNWYGIDLMDLVRGAPKLGFTPEQMRRVLETAPWTGGGGALLA